MCPWICVRARRRRVGTQLREAPREVYLGRRRRRRRRRAAASGGGGGASSGGGGAASGGGGAASCARGGRGAGAGAGTHFHIDRRKAQQTLGGYTRLNAVVFVLFQRFPAIRLGRARVLTLAPFELLCQEFLPRVAVCGGPLIPEQFSVLLLLLRRLPIIVSRRCRASFLVGLRGARQGPEADVIRAPFAPRDGTRASWGGRAPPSRAQCATMAYVRGSRRRSGAHIHGAPPLGAWTLGLEGEEKSSLPSHHLRPLG